MGSPFHLGRILVQQGAVTELQLRVALRHHETQRCRLGEALLALEYCTPAQIGRALAEQLGMYFVDMEKMPPSREALQAVPVSVARKFGIVPIDIDEEYLLLVARNPSDFRLDGWLRKELGWQVVIACGVDEQIEWALKHYNHIAWEKGVGSTGDPVEHKQRAVLRKEVRQSVLGRVEAPAPDPDAVERLIQEHLTAGREIHLEIDANSIAVRGEVEDGDAILATLPQGFTRVILTVAQTGKGAKAVAAPVCRIRKA